jgi:hypothetical protein
MAKEHDQRQPFIQEDIVDALIMGNNCTSYRTLSRHIHINGRCMPSTIEQWLRFHPTYQVYAKNIKPGLTEQNRGKQVIFSKHVHNRWGIIITTKKILVHRSNVKLVLN